MQPLMIQSAQDRTACRGVAHGPASIYIGGILYDTRFNAVNRYRFAVGVEIPIRKAILDLYLLRQEDNRPEPAHSNVLGIAVSFHF